jgi:hypothetical protein
MKQEEVRVSFELYYSLLWRIFKLGFFVKKQFLDVPAPRKISRDFAQFPIVLHVLS